MIVLLLMLLVCLFAVFVVVVVVVLLCFNWPASWAATRRLPRTYVHLRRVDAVTQDLYHS